MDVDKEWEWHRGANTLQYTHSRALSTRVGDQCAHHAKRDEVTIMCFTRCF